MKYSNRDWSKALPLITDEERERWKKEAEEKERLGLIDYIDYRRDEHIEDRQTRIEDKINELVDAINKIKRATQ